MEEAEAILIIFYLILSFCIIYPPTEFVACAFTIEGICSHCLGSENENFISFHVKRTLLTLLIYSLLPLGYITLLILTGFVAEVTALFYEGSLLWRAFLTSSIALPLLALIQIYIWYVDNFKNHPIAINLQKFCNNNNTDWKSVASDINAEFRRIDKVSIQTNPLTKVVVTENWILKVTPFTILIAHQTGASLVVKGADTHEINPHNSIQVQFLNIEVKSNRGIEPFTIRINASDFKDLEDRVGRNIPVLPDIKFHKNVIEQFIDVFKETVEKNPKYETDDELENCIGCMQATSNVKLQKLCQDESDTVKCVTCYCRPMWCVDCVAKWFASRQDTALQSTWLSSKCPCPMCRSMFCILDVCLVHSRIREE